MKAYVKIRSRKGNIILEAELIRYYHNGSTHVLAIDKRRIDSCSSEYGKWILWDALTGLSIYVGFKGQTKAEVISQGISVLNENFERYEHCIKERSFYENDYIVSKVASKQMSIPKYR